MYMLTSILVNPPEIPFSGLEIENMEISHFTDKLLNNYVEVLYFNF